MRYNFIYWKVFVMDYKLKYKFIKKKTKLYYFGYLKVIY